MPPGRAIVLSFSPQQQAISNQLTAYARIADGKLLTAMAQYQETVNCER
jgi:hypothetical protein